MFISLPRQHKQLGDAATELRQNVSARQFLGFFNHDRFLTGFADSHVFGFRVNHPNHPSAELQLFAHAAHHLARSVVGRKHFNCQQRCFVAEFEID